MNEPRRQAGPDATITTRSSPSLARFANTAYDRLVDRLADVARNNGTTATARCPAHEDRTPSLSVRRIEGSVLLHCFAGCEVEDILATVGLTKIDLYDDRKGATYRYDDGRIVHRSPDKRFRQSGNTKGAAQLYRLAAVTKAVADGTVVYVVEGEKDVHAIESLGAVATTNPMGAANWHKVDTTPLHGGNIIVIPDVDAGGRTWVRDVLATLHGHCRAIEIRAPKTGKDPADHIAAGHGLDDLYRIELVPDDDDVAPAIDERIEFEVDRLRVQHQARLIFAAELRGQAPPFDAGLLDDVLARPADPPMRVDGFLPSDGRLLVVAQRKTGKTTFDLNLILSMLDGGYFLGRFVTRPLTGNVAILNYELSAAMLAGWAQQVGIAGHRLLLVNLRGRRNPLGHPDDRDRLVELLRDHQAQALIVDPFGRAYTGKSQNDPGEVTAWLCDLDRFATDASIAEVVLSTHAGWDGERSRGASSLEDWADVVATLVRDPDDETARYLRAFGRDVEVDEDRLVFEPDTRTLTLAGAGSRKRSKAERAVEAAMPDVLDYVTDNPGCSGQDIRRSVDGGHSAVDQARRRLVQKGTIKEDPRPGRGGGKCYRVPDEPDKP